MSVSRRMRVPVATPELVVWTDESDRSTLTSSPTVTSGSGVPSENEPDGSIYLRTNGTSNTTLYVRSSGSWVPGVIADGVYIPKSAFTTSSRILESTGASTYAEVEGTSAATVSTYMKRDASGRSKLVASAAPGDITIREEVSRSWIAPTISNAGSLNGALMTDLVDTANNRTWQARIGNTTMGTSGPDVVEIASNLWHVQWGAATTSSSTFDMRDTNYGAPKISTLIFPDEWPLDYAYLYSRFTGSGNSNITANVFSIGLHLIMQATHAVDNSTGDFHHIQGQLKLSTSSGIRARFRRTRNSSTTDIAETSDLAGFNLSAGMDIRLKVTRTGYVTMAYKAAASADYIEMGTTTYIGDYRIVACGLHSTNASATTGAGGALELYATLPTWTQG